MARAPDPVAAAEPAALAAFAAGLGGEERAARVWPDAARALRFRRAAFALTLRMLAEAARRRGLAPPEAWKAAFPGELPPALAAAPPAAAGGAYARLLGRCPRFVDGVWTLAGSGARRAAGAYFTPPALAEHLASLTLGPRIAGASVEELARLRVVDPAMGAGAFLVAAFRALRGRALELGLEPREAAATALGTLHGVDLDPALVAMAAGTLWIEAGDPALSPDDLTVRLHTGDALMDSPSALAGSFDAVLGNPPWGKLKVDLKAFVTLLDPRARDRQGAGIEALLSTEIEAAWRAFRAERVSSGRRLAESGAFPAQGRGDRDLYRYFLERAVALAGPDGRVGLVLPAAVLRSAGAAGLRRLLLEQGGIEALVGLANRDRAFPIHGMFAYALLVWRRGAPAGIRGARLGLPGLAALARPGETLDLSSEWLQRVGGPELIVPTVRSAAERDLCARLHARHPPLGAAHPAWNVRFVRELDMTTDSGRFLERDELRRLGAESADGLRWRMPDGRLAVPLYEGRLVQPFDHLAKAYSGGAGRRARWGALPLGAKVLRPHYWVPVEEPLPARAGFCDITSHANARTALCALLPAGTAAGNKVPTLRFQRDDPRLPHLWLAVANSLVVDWLLRRRVDTTLNFFHWRAIPFPRLDPDHPAARPLWTAAVRLSALDAASTEAASALLLAHGEEEAVPLDAAARARLRAALDVAVAALFGLEEGDLALILEDFPLLEPEARARVLGVWRGRAPCPPGPP